MKLCRHCKQAKENLIVDCTHYNKDKTKRYKYYSCCECNTERHRKYRQTKSGKLATRKAVYKSIAKYPERQKARVAVQWAIKSGRLVKPEKCSRCPSKERHAHHEDYSKPLDIVWLCRKCHRKEHQGVL